MFVSAIHQYESAVSSVQSLSRVRLFANPWTAARQASLSITNSQSSLKFMSMELVTPSNHLILCHPLLLLPPIPPSIRVFSKESALYIRWQKDWSLRLSDIYIHPLPLEPPSHPIPPSGSSQSAKLSSLLCRAACHYFTPDSVYMSVLLSSFAPLPPSHAAPQVCSLLRISIPALQIGLSVQFF